MRPDRVCGQLWRRSGQGPQDQDQGMPSVEGKIPAQAYRTGQQVNDPRASPVIERGFLCPESERIFNLESFHKLFTRPYVGSNHPLDATPCPFPSGLFFACDKTFSKKAVQPSRTTRLSARMSGLCSL